MITWFVAYLQYKLSVMKECFLSFLTFLARALNIPQNSLLVRWSSSSEAEPKPPHPSFRQ